MNMKSHIPNVHEIDVVTSTVFITLIIPLIIALIHAF